MRAVFFVVLGLVCGCWQPDAVVPIDLEDQAFAPIEEEQGPLVEEELEEPHEPVGFFGEDDSPRIEALSEEAIVRVRAGRGGRSLAFKITLRDGSQGYFKPEQTFSGAHWYSEIAAYHLDRALGFGRTAPVVGRRVRWRLLERAAEDHPRSGEAIIDEDGMVRGAFIWWIPGRLRPWPLGQDWEHFVRVQGGLDITPYQRANDYRARINGDALREETELGSFSEAPETLTDEEVAQLSDLIVFDYLISNVDRWGGEYTNVRRRGLEQLVFLDNGAGFWEGARLGLMEARLSALQRFRRSTRAALEAFSIEEFAARLASDPLAPTLPPSQLDALAERVEVVLDHMHEMNERFGEARVWIDG